MRRAEVFQKKIYQSGLLRRPETGPTVEALLEAHDPDG